MRDQWNSKLGFLLAAIGSAVGLGNIWRFPYIAASNGGGAFLLPYFFAIITAGIPIVMLEYTIGKTYKGGAPVSLARMNKKFEWLGWLQVMVAFLIMVYYFAIVVWTVSYIGFSFTQSWGTDTTAFFLKYIGLSENPRTLGGLQTNLIPPFLIVWALTAYILFKGVSKGIEKACQICIPLLFFLIVILVVRGLTLPGAFDGLEYMFKPDWSALTKSSVWVAAYGQIFFSLSIAFAIMIAYSSYLPKKTDVVNSAIITATTNHGFEIFAGIGVFAIMGYMAFQQGKTVNDIAGAGVGLAFMTFPTAISSLPALNAVFGFCFFGALFTAGITSLVSICQAVISGMQDKFQMTHKQSTTTVLVPAFLLSILFITGAGLHILDIVDAFTNQIGIAVCGFLEVLLIAWFFNPETLRKEANSFSNFSVGKWWTFSLKFITVIVLGYMTLSNTKDFIVKGYGDYAKTDLLLYGWSVIGIIIVGAIIFTMMKGKPGYDQIPSDQENE